MTATGAAVGVAKNINGVMQVRDKYKEVRTLEFPGMTARVYIPDLTDAERAERMKAIYKAAADLVNHAKK